MVIGPQFPGGFNDEPILGGLAKTTVDNRKAYIDKTGKVVWQENPQKTIAPFWRFSHKLTSRIKVPKPILEV